MGYREIEFYVDSRVSTPFADHAIDKPGGNFMVITNLHIKANFLELLAIRHASRSIGFNVNAIISNFLNLLCWPTLNSDALKIIAVRILNLIYLI